MTESIGSPTELAMAEQFRVALKTSGVSQAVFARRVGVSTKHLNQVILGKATARMAALDYWAFVLGFRWSVTMAPLTEDDPS
jgi:transcriptional regulator with XRE-family HTH domain